MDQEMIRRGQRRRRELFVAETTLDQGHKGEGAHVHPQISSREVVVTNFVGGENGELTAVTRTIGKERV
jgi:hypothetical protein